MIHFPSDCGLMQTRNVMQCWMQKKLLLNTGVFIKFEDRSSGFEPGLLRNSWSVNVLRKITMSSISLLVHSAFLNGWIRGPNWLHNETGIVMIQYLFKCLKSSVMHAWAFTILQDLGFWIFPYLYCKVILAPTVSGEQNPIHYSCIRNPVNVLPKNMTMIAISFSRIGK